MYTSDTKMNGRCKEQARVLCWRLAHDCIWQHILLVDDFLARERETVLSFEFWVAVLWLLWSWFVTILFIVRSTKNKCSEQFGTPRIVFRVKGIPCRGFWVWSGGMSPIERLFWDLEPRPQLVPLPLLYLARQLGNPNRMRCHERGQGLWFVFRKPVSISVISITVTQNSDPKATQFVSSEIHKSG